MKLFISRYKIIVCIIFALCCPGSTYGGGGEESFTVALTGKYPPFSFYSSEGELIGFDVDIAGKIADKNGV